MSNNYYDILWISKSSSDEEIKKAYRKLAMKYHPDRNKGDKQSEKKFKEINEAYWVLSDSQKRKQYDTFWRAWESHFSSWNYSSSDFSGFEDIFSEFWWASWKKSSSFNIDIEDLFWWFSSNSSSSPFWWYNSSKKEAPKKPDNLDFEKTYEIPIFDLILGCFIEISWVYGKKVKLKIPAWTLHWTKFRVKWLWKSDKWKKWNLIVIIKSLMPKNISPVDLKMLETIRENITY